MGDPEIVGQLLAGQSAGLAAVYDRYAARLYDYAVGMLRDRDAAADAVHDALLIAADRAGQLRDPEKLRPWLYAITRNECHRLLRARKRETDLDNAGEVTDTSVDLDRGLRAAEAQALVRDAAAGLNAGDREVLNLTLRHELAGDELGAALGVPANHANALVSRARAQLERAVGALVMARTGRQDCAELAQLLTGWDGELTALVRKRVSRHVEQCQVCDQGKQRKVNAAALFATIPLIAVPATLRSRVVDSSPDVEMVAYRQQIGRRAQPFDRQGFPVPLAQRRHQLMVPWIAAGLLIVLLIGAGLALWRDPGTDSAASVLPSPTPAPTSAPATSAPPTPSASPTPSPTPSTASPTPTPSRSPSRTPSPTPTSASPSPTPSPRVRPPTVTITVQDGPGGNQCGTWASSVSSVVTGGTPGTVTAFWAAGQQSGSTELRLLRGAWRGRLTGLPAGVRITVSVKAVTSDAGTGWSELRTVSNDLCPG